MSHIKKYFFQKINTAGKIILPYFRYWFRTYKFNIKKYPNSYLSNEPSIKKIDLKKAPEIVYTLWTGNNKLTFNRKKGIESLQKIVGVKVILITTKNLNEFILKDFPIHRAYEYLSLNHRSDYLRCYLMLHYGGGYADIKIFDKSWKNAFEKLNESNDKWCLGYHERNIGSVAFTDGKLGVDLSENYLSLIGNGAYIFKPNNPISKECMKELNRRLDGFYESLKNNPAIDPFGQNANYPIPWNYLGGHILHPLELKYHEHIMYSDTVKQTKDDYR